MFTFGGSYKEFPVLLRGFAQLAGRDAHFFGDLNRIKCLWHENIKFFDLSNFFDTASFKKLSTEWRKNTILTSSVPHDSLNSTSTSDPAFEKVNRIF